MKVKCEPFKSVRNSEGKECMVLCPRCMGSGYWYKRSEGRAQTHALKGTYRAYRRLFGDMADPMKVWARALVQDNNNNDGLRWLQRKKLAS